MNKPKKTLRSDRLVWMPLLILGLCVMPRAAAQTPEAPTNSPAENFILNNAGDWKAIDLATNFPAVTDRVVSASLLRDLLTTNQNQIRHRGLRLQNAVVDGWLNLENLDITCEVRLEQCRFKHDVKLSGAHFYHDLSFQGSVFEGSLMADALKVDGSLFLSEADTTNAEYASLPGGKLDAASVLALCTNEQGPWPTLGRSPLVFNPERGVTRWQIADLENAGRPNFFEATLFGSNFYLLQTDGGRPPPGTLAGRTIGPFPIPPEIRTNPEPLNLKVILQYLAATPDTHQGFISNLASRVDAVILPNSFRWQYDGPDEFVSPLVARWDWWDPVVAYSRPTRFSGEVHLNGAVIGGKLEASGVEFLKTVDCAGLKVGADLYMPGARFDLDAHFGHAQVGYDFAANDDLFEGASASFDANGMTVGGSLIIERARFEAPACFEEVSVAKAFRGSQSCFDFDGDMADFSGLKVGGSVDLGQARFAGPANFVLARISGNFDCSGVRFGGAHSFLELRQITGNTTTFNADFGSIQVDGFAIFENAFFGRSVSFRNAKFGNLFLDGVQWPDNDFLALNYTASNPPPATSLLRVEGMDFQTIRNITSNRFDDSPEQLRESATNLLTMLQDRAPYSFDVYSKLEDYFRREGEPGLADQVFIAAKRREGAESSGMAKFSNWLLYLTVGYGRLPWRAFWESVVCIGLWAAFCNVWMVKMNSTNRPGVLLALLYSLSRFLPFVDLKADNLLDFKKGREWFRFVLGLETLLGAVLVPLWTIALAGLIK